jgi:hypothetical protein
MIVNFGLGFAGQAQDYFENKPGEQLPQQQEGQKDCRRHGNIPPQGFKGGYCAGHP